MRGDQEAARIRAWLADNGWRRSLVGAFEGDRLIGFANVLHGASHTRGTNGALQWQPTSVSVEEYEDETALLQEQGRTAVESIALDRHRQWLPGRAWLRQPGPDRPAQIEGTLALAQHRGQRLGAAVKVACLLAARAHGRATRVRTSSDDRNPETPLVALHEG